MYTYYSIAIAYVPSARVITIVSVEDTGDVCLVSMLGVQLLVILVFFAFFFSKSFFFQSSIGLSPVESLQPSGISHFELSILKAVDTRPRLDLKQLSFFLVSAHLVPCYLTTLSFRLVAVFPDWSFFSAVFFFLLFFKEAPFIFQSRVKILFFLFFFVVCSVVGLPVCLFFRPKNFLTFLKLKKKFFFKKFFLLKNFIIFSLN